MTLPGFPIEGGCRCDRLRFRLAAPPLMEVACHCTGCRKMSASAFSTTLMMPVDAFSVIAGEPVIGGLRDPRLRHHHCEWCKSWVFTRIPGMPFVNVRATMLDDASWFAPWMETCVDEALPWARTGATERFAHFPDMADFDRLIARYRQHRGSGAAADPG